MNLKTADDCNDGPWPLPARRRAHSKFVEANFATCESKKTISNRFGVPKEETEFHKYHRGVRIEIQGLFGLY
jgi:hypothetical protein